MTTYLVTGANSGLGLELTRKLAARNERVIMAVRDVRKGEAARSDVLKSAPNASIRVVPLDLADLSSVHALAAMGLEVDVLINNAATAFVAKALTPEGVVTQLGANHLGHFALTGLLLERLSRVVTVTSSLAKKGTLDFENLDGSRNDSRATLYTQSKIANTLFGAELDRRMRTRALHTTSVLAHPGIASTQMQQTPTGVLGIALKFVSAFIAQRADRAVLPLFEAATSPTAKSGSVWGPAKREGAKEEPTWPTMKDLTQATALWALSEKLTKVSYL